MSIVIVGGHDRMVCTYREICKKHKCKAKVFTQMPANFKTMVGKPDLLILFTNTVSHKMVVSALQAVEHEDTIIKRCHSSSACALTDILQEHCLVS
jgi:glutamate synthase domain-containing protein 2